MSSVRTIAEVEAMVRREVAQLRDKILVVDEVDTAVDGVGVRTIRLQPPARARILPATCEVVRWTTGGWCDPLYAVELLEDRPELRGLSACWVYGRAYSTNGQSASPGYRLEMPHTADRPVHGRPAGEDGRVAAARRPRP